MFLIVSVVGMKMPQCPAYEPDHSLSSGYWYPHSGMIRERKRIAIIGAGVSGLTLARSLRQQYEVVVSERTREVGGRMSTYYSEPFSFDHGTQYFTARTRMFQNFLRTYMDSGVVRDWTGKVITL